MALNSTKARNGRTVAKVGLTGGIGSGKSAVADCFAKLGVTVIDADAIARELTAPGGEQVDAVVKCFGEEIKDASGAIDRKKLGEMVFSSEERRKQLEAILHPPIRAKMLERAARADGAYCVLDIPLLVESGQYHEMLRRVAVVSCARETRIARLRSKRGMRAADIARVMQSQASEEERLAEADDVIYNNGAQADLAPRVEELHAEYSQLFGGSAK
ncbi:MAG: dephospho-CoA kinase [Gammaproteobacteria bacterium]|nr:dephospho-CoA kinase [Gammaproteobacteria bacterium]MDA7962704.1 dephospho-CoA kinase [Gammaproteobacteria bacterium]MDA7971484.1 dephospho-CoA kinase [Gammaproteobacteria bacterium]MDA8022046.1 dephospho-CoA kinase [Gammaproteobacteria bacterium]